MAGIAIREVEPLNITDPNNVSPIISEGLQYGIYPAAISSLTKDMAERSGLSPHTLTSTTSIHLAQVGCNDIRADGKLDGLGYTTDDEKISQLGFGTISLTPRIYRTEVAQHMLIIARSELNKSGLTAADYLIRAQSLSTMDSELFDKIAPEPVDLNGPFISIDLPSNTFIKGTVDLDFNITDPLGIKRIEFYVDNNLANINSGETTIFSLDTKCCNYSDGPHEIKIVAYDALDNESTFTRTYNFDNTGPIVTINSQLLVNEVNYVATGTYQLEGADIKAILVNGSPATINTIESKWTTTVALQPGNNTITIQAEDNNNNFSTEVLINVAVDTVAPELRNSANISIRTSTGNLNTPYTSCDNDKKMEFNDANPLYALCIPDNRIHLNGKLISVDLLNDSYSLIAYQVNDMPIDNIFTSADELKIDYKIEKNGSLYQDWKSTPERDSVVTDWLLPITTEFLGDTWFQTSIDSVFIITFRATDLAGNSSSTPYTMRFNISPSTTPLIASFSNKEIITATNFNNRTSIDGKAFTLEYTYASDPTVRSYISFEDSTNHTVLHLHEKTIRKNIARINSQEIWQVKYISFNASTQIILSAWTNTNSLYYWSGDPTPAIISPQQRLVFSQIITKILYQNPLTIHGQMLPLLHIVIALI